MILIHKRTLFLTNTGYGANTDIILSKKESVLAISDKVFFGLKKKNLLLKLKHRVKNLKRE